MIAPLYLHGRLSSKVWLHRQQQKGHLATLLTHPLPGPNVEPHVSHVTTHIHEQLIKIVRAMRLIVLFYHQRKVSVHIRCA